MKTGKELLMDALHLGTFVDFTATSDGFFLAMRPGDCGFNAFLGKPSFHEGPGKERTRAVFGAMTFAERKRFVGATRRYGLDPHVMLR